MTKEQALEQASEEINGNKSELSFSASESAFGILMLSSIYYRAMSIYAEDKCREQLRLCWEEVRPSSEKWEAVNEDTIIESPQPKFN